MFVVGQEYNNGGHGMSTAEYRRNTYKYKWIEERNTVIEYTLSSPLLQLIGGVIVFTLAKTVIVALKNQWENNSNLCHGTLIPHK